MASIDRVPYMTKGKFNGNEFGTDDLKEQVRAFKELKLAGKLPVKLGHDTDSSKPAHGWITDIYLDGEVLYADLDQVPEDLVDEIRAGRWRHVSIELLRDVKRNGKMYAWVPDAIAILGSARPAVDVLDGLDKLVASALPGLTFGARVAFSREMETEAERVRRQMGGELETLRRTSEADKQRLENERVQLQRDLIRVEFNAAIDAGKILPRDREAFMKRYGDAGTVDDARVWIGSSPKPPDHLLSGTKSSLKTDVKKFERADDELTYRVQECIKEHFKEYGEKIDMQRATGLVLRADPDLAHRYYQMPTALWGSR